MSYGMFVSAAGAHAQSQRLEVLSNNLANVDTVGFRREFAVLQARHAEAIEQGAAAPGAQSMNDVGGGVLFAETMTDFSSGSLRETNVASDLAIEGDGFFTVEQNGETVLTRAGNFQVGSDGGLLTQQGLPVLGADGQAMQLNPGQPWRWLPGGILEQGGGRQPVGLVRPQSMGDLVKVGENLFRSLAPVAPVEGSERRVASGFLEHSSVKPALEMMELIETSRAFESNVRMIQNHDQVVGSLVSRVLRGN